MLVSIIQSWSLLAFNGPSANVLSGQRGPRAQRHFNGCHDERVKSEHGDPVSSIGKKREGGQDRGEERGVRGGVKATGGRTDGIIGQVCEQRGDGEKQEEEGGKRGGNWAIRSLRFAIGYRSIILKMMMC